MTIVRRCDVCDRMADANELINDKRSWGSFTFSYDPAITDKIYFDLCPDCAKKVKESLKTIRADSPKEDRPNDELADDWEVII